ncbi:hypothetical protein RF11_15559 [Thelohanellus kitauei]|uniref:Uncharacterized protein n=1 Tax=Thelohanellus kitauei TaxID=669202 RepID=A0A0C2I6F3_THEKT|nr:hypothetical protein RF11_15559 [Thelohanellus kitauei]
MRLHKPRNASRSVQVKLAKSNKLITDMQTIAHCHILSGRGPKTYGPLRGRHDLQGQIVSSTTRQINGLRIGDLESHKRKEGGSRSSFEDMKFATWLLVNAKTVRTDTCQPRLCPDWAGLRLGSCVKIIAIKAQIAETQGTERVNQLLSNDEP